uniref:Uncharacterized protein n=1 Tax=Ixodes ricinus TaxID=34613 RepID=A0A6B0V3Z7_IXORI
MPLLARWGGGAAGAVAAAADEEESRLKERLRLRCMCSSSPHGSPAGVVAGVAVGLGHLTPGGPHPDPPRPRTLATPVEATDVGVGIRVGVDGLPGGTGDTAEEEPFPGESLLTPVALGGGMAAFLAACMLAALLASALKAVWGTRRGIRGMRRRPSMAHSAPVLGPRMRSAMVFNLSSLTALRISARCRSSDMQRMPLSSWSIFFLSLVSSPWARKADTTEAYASSSSFLSILWHSSRV